MLRSAAANVCGSLRDLGLIPTRGAEEASWGNSGLVRFTIAGMNALALSVTLASAVAALGSGCASSAPRPAVASQYPATYPVNNEARTPNNTTRGAIAGAVGGAVIGGIIGNNSEHGNTEKGAAIGAVAGGLAGAAIGHRADQRDSAGVSSADTGYTVRSVPPAPGSEPYESVPPQPAQNAVWIRGQYVYTGSGYQWQAGRWEIPPNGARIYVAPSWQPAANGGYVYVRGHWQ